MGWKRKWAKDTLKAALPFQDRLRQLKRRLVPYQTHSGFDEFTFEQGLEQVRLLAEAGAPLPGKSVLELGTGWQPLIPFLCRVAGAAHVTLTDQERLMDARTVANASAFLHERRLRIAERLGLTEVEVERRIQVPGAADLETLLGHLHMSYLVPYEIDRTPTASVDVVTSRAVLEHVSPKLIERLLAGFARILKPGGVTCHIIDNSDHWEHKDKSISRVNFLKYDDWVIGALGLNVQNYQNRLRHFEYLDLFRRAGYEVLKEVGEVDDSALAALPGMKVCARYAGSPARDLAILTSYVVARPVESSGPFL